MHLRHTVEVPESPEPGEESLHWMESPECEDHRLVEREIDTLLEVSSPTTPAANRTPTPPLEGHRLQPHFDGDEHEERRAQCNNAYARIISDAHTRHLDSLITTTGAGPDLRLAMGAQVCARRQGTRPLTAVPASPERRERKIYEGADSLVTGMPHKMRYSSNTDPL